MKFENWIIIMICIVNNMENNDENKNWNNNNFVKIVWGRPGWWPVARSSRDQLGRLSEAIPA